MISSLQQPLRVLSLSTPKPTMTTTMTNATTTSGFLSGWMIRKNEEDSLSPPRSVQAIADFDPDDGGNQAREEQRPTDYNCCLRHGDDDNDDDDDTEDKHEGA